MNMINDITWGYEIISNTVNAAHAIASRQVRTIEMKKTNGRKIYLAVIQETLDGDYCTHAII